jgi:hypothetical protein
MIRNNMEKTTIYTPLYGIGKSNELDLRLSTDFGFSEFSVPKLPSKADGCLPKILFEYPFPNNNYSTHNKHTNFIKKKYHKNKVIGIVPLFALFKFKA